jgi:hypothetical protein
MKFNVTRFGLTLGLAAAIAFSGPAPGATNIKKCQKLLEKNAKNFQNAVLTRLTKVSDAMRKGPIDIKLAGRIEKWLARFYGSGKAVDKFRAKIDSLYPAKCTDDYLSSLGFLLSSTTPHTDGKVDCAPGSHGANPAIKFTEDYLLVKAEADAFDMMLAEAPLFSDQLLQLQKLADCTYPYDTYPYLCKLKSECVERVCMLGDDAGSTSQWHSTSGLFGTPGSPGTAIYTLSGAHVMGMCFMDGDLTGTESGFMYIIGQQGRGLGMVVDLGGKIYVCVDTLRQAGYCDCGALTHAFKNVTDCMDRDVFKHNPGDPGTGCTEVSATATGTDACLSKCSAGQADINYLGDYNGLPNIECDPSGDLTTVGDCVDMVTYQFTVITPPLAGYDTIPCTADDRGGVNSPIPVVLTTGKSQSTLKHPVQYQGYGHCKADYANNTCHNNPSVTCFVDSDCPGGTCGITGTPCVGKCYNPCINKLCRMPDKDGDSVACTRRTAATVCSTECLGTVYDPDTTGALRTGHIADDTGDPYASGCDLYRQNHLTGMRLVGTFPGSWSAKSGDLGDTLNTFEMNCQ